MLAPVLFIRTTVAKSVTVLYNSILNMTELKSLFSLQGQTQPFFFMLKASCWDYDDFYMGKTKRPLHDRKTEDFKALTKSCDTSAIADYITSTGHNIKWDHFDILANGRSDMHC